MSKKSKYLILSLIALALVLGVGAISTSAALTLEALTITSSGILTLNGDATSNIILGGVTTTGNIAIGSALTIGNIILGGTSGNVGIGTTSPTALLHLKAGTATAGTAPLKFTAGTNLGTTEAGAVEYDGTHLYFSAANAGTRYQLDRQSPTSAGVTVVYNDADLTTALAAQADGQTITLAPGTYTQNVTITANNFTFQGIDRYHTIINGDVTVSGYPDTISGVRVNGTVSNTNQAEIPWGYQNRFENMIINGNIVNGISTCTATEYLGEARYNNVVFLGAVGRTWTHYCGMVNVTNSTSSGTTWPDNAMSINIYSGEFNVSLTDTFYIKDINFVGNHYANIYLEDGSYSIQGNITNLANKTTQYSILAFVNCQVRNPNYLTTTWTFTGLFELDVIQSEFRYPNIVFNSTGNSRITDMVGLGYNNPNTISGSGLAKLYIQNSIFHSAAPAGLGANQQNLWSAFLDE